MNNQISALFNYAESFYGILPNPTKMVEKTGKDRSDEMDFWTKEEYTCFLDAIANKPKSFYAFEILFWTGIREGELLALTPADFDFENCTLRINKTFGLNRGEEIVGLPKTANAYRTIVISGFPGEQNEMADALQAIDAERNLDS